jgi:hypothetical protein
MVISRLLSDLTLIFKKVGVKGPHGLVVYTYQHGLAKPTATSRPPGKPEKKEHERASPAIILPKLRERCWPQKGRLRL